MTNFEHMTEEEKKMAIINGMHITTSGEYKVCRVSNCTECVKRQYNTRCDRCTRREERGEWLNAEYIKPKTKNEKFCETLMVDEVIAVRDEVWESEDCCVYRAFKRYNSSRDLIETKDGYHWDYGRKLTAEERGE